MTTQNNQNERLLKFLQASPETQAEIDRILEGKVQARVEASTGPLLLSHESRKSAKESDGNFSAVARA